MTHAGTNFLQYFSLILIAFVVALIARRFAVPYALALVVTGLAIGFSHLLPKVHLDPSVLLTVFLPPLLFESAIHLRIDALKRSWLPITIYTLAGTVLSTFIIGGLAAWLLHLPIAVALVFGALISTTDPISVIAVFRRLGANKRLTLIMEAESLFNNDTAVVLFTIMMTIAVGGRLNALGSVYQFFFLVVGGALTGAVAGGVASRIHYDLDDHLVEITLTTVVAFGSYLLAERLGVSGVMAVVAAGLVIGNYGMPRTMSASTRLAVTAFWEYAAFVVNSVVFLLVGIEVAYVRWTDKFGMACIAIVIVLIGRAVIYPLSFVVNRLKGDIPPAWQHALFWGGLRGALSMALVLGLGHDFPNREMLVAATFAVVVFSLLVQGMTVGPLMKRLALVGAPASHDRETRRLANEIAACEAALFELDRMSGREDVASWSIEHLVRNYRERLTRLEEEIMLVNPQYVAERDRERAEVRAAALSAEKGAYNESERQGRMDTSEWQAVRARIDAEILALRPDDRVE